MHNNELYHYGVLGMKWGVHRARKYTKKADIARRQGRTADAEQYESKSKAISEKHRRLGGKAYDYSKNQSTGKAVVKSALLGTYGTLKYNQIRASGASRGKAAAKAVLYNIGNNATVGILSIAEPRYNRDRS